MTENFEYLLNNDVDKKVVKTLNYFWLGFIIYSLVWAIGTAFSKNYSVIQYLQIISFLIFIPTAINLIQFKIDNNYLKSIYFFYCVWSVIVIFRGFLFNTDFVKDMLFNSDFGIFPYLAPLILLFPRDLFFYRKVFRVILVLGLFYVAYDILFIKILLNPDHTNLTSQGTVETFSKYLSIPAGFLLLTYNYHSKKNRLFAISVILLSLLFDIIRARRGLISMCLATIVFSYILYLFAAKGRLMIIFLSIFAVFFISNYISEIVTKNKNSIFSFLIERGDVDTRAGVEEYFYTDMKTNDWIIGKGLNGQYFCPDVDENGLTDYRSMIETDYLNIILKGGLVRLGLLLLIIIPAIFLGLFYSKNMLSKAAGVWILLWLLSLYPANVSTFTLNYLLVWISVGICYSRRLRNMPEDSVKGYFRSVI